MICRSCRSARLKKEIGTYSYVESGLPNVVLHGVEVAECLDCGKKAVKIPAIETLHRMLARMIAYSAPKLTSHEIRFLRKSLGWSGRDFAAKIGVSVETVSRWENGKENMGIPAERLLRAMVLRDEPERKYLDNIEGLALKDVPPRNRIQLYLKDHDWRFGLDPVG